MTADITTLDAHEQPSAYLRRQWKAYARMPAADVVQSGDIDEIEGEEDGEVGEVGDDEDDDAAGKDKNAAQNKGRRRQGFCTAGVLSAAQARAAFAAFLADASPVDGDLEDGDSEKDDSGAVGDTPIHYHPLLPGLLVLRGLVPPRVQKRLLDRMVHRDLSCPRHQTNLHLHYDLPYPPAGASFFAYPPPDNPHAAADDSGRRANPPRPGTFAPKDPAVHRPLSAQQVLDKRLHWVTLGGQYDWTRRVYRDDGGDGADESAGGVPPFPPDLARLLTALFPETDAQAAIVNFYSPGDTMMIHRDVSEQTDRGLISLSFGCDALFMAAPTHEFAEAAAPAAADGDDDAAEKKEPYVLLRLRSGDAIYMSGHARFAWHGVPKVVKDTCPAFLADWPAGEHRDGRYEPWRGWMRNKRINLNVRQMQE